MSTRKKQNKRKICCFCGLSENNELEFGKFYDHDGILTHYYCLLLSSNMEQNGNDNEGILGFLSSDIQKELRRGKKLVCTYCKKVGATLGCCNIKCKRIFHFPCSLRAGSLHQFFGEFRSYCINHRPRQKIDDHIRNEIKNCTEILCCICYDEVNTRDIRTALWSPCCKKNTWFHRKCVQQLAMSAGYFFKCPLCNNKKKFQEEMLEYGIFIPSQDASWELVPNAFQELLYRHNRCDAEICLSPKGRNYTSSNAKWELTLCRTCGSQGIHMACGRLKWANPIWDCTECTNILFKPKDSSIVRMKSSDQHDELCSEDSDTDISVGTDSPVPFVQINHSSPSTLPNLQNNIRPGPRSFKLQQIKANNLAKSMENEMNSSTLKQINSLPQLSNSLCPQQPTDSQDNQKNASTSSFKNKSIFKSEQDKNLSSNNPSQSMSKIEFNDVIIVDSDDDIIEIINNRSTKKQTLANQDVESNNLNTIQNAKSMPITNKNISEINTRLHDTDDLILVEDTIQQQIGAGKHQECLKSKFANSKDEPVMNIKIINVTSLPPEVFASVPESKNEDVNLFYLNSNSETSDCNVKDTSNENHKSLSSIYSNPVESNLKRKHEMSYFANTATNDTRELQDNCKKVKEIDHYSNSNTYDSIMYNILNKPASIVITKLPQDSSGISSKDVVTVPSTYKCRTERIPVTTTKIVETNASIQQSPTSKPDSIIDNYNKSNSLVDNTEKKNIMKIDLPSATNTYTTNSTNLYNSGTVFITIPQNALSSRNIILAQQITKEKQTSDEKNISDTSILSQQTSSNNATTTNKLAIGNLMLTNTSNNIQIGVSDSKIFFPTNNNRMEIRTSKSVSQSDGDAGCSNLIVETRIDNSSNEQRPAKQTCVPTNFYSRRTSPIKIIPSISRSLNSSTYSMFSEITSNPNACDRPRLIPEHVHLHDLKFRIRNSENLQMILYDTFSVNINMNTDPKDSVNNSDSFENTSYSGKCFVQVQDELSTTCSDYQDSIDSTKGYLDREKSNSNVFSNKSINRCDDVKENLDPVTTIVYNNTPSSLIEIDTSDILYQSINKHAYEENNTANISPFDSNIIDRTMVNSEFSAVCKENKNKIVPVLNHEINDSEQNMHNASKSTDKGAHIELSSKNEDCIVNDTDFNFDVTHVTKTIQKTLLNKINTLQTFKDSSHHRSDVFECVEKGPSQDIRMDRNKDNYNEYSNNVNVINTNDQCFKLNFASNNLFTELNLNKNLQEVKYDITNHVRSRTISHQDCKYVMKSIENVHEKKISLKVSIDLEKIQNLIETKPHLFIKHKSDINNQMQVHQVLLNRYSESESNSRSSYECIKKSLMSKLQKSNSFKNSISENNLLTFADCKNDYAQYLNKINNVENSLKCEDFHNVNFVKKCQIQDKNHISRHNRKYCNSKR